MVVENHALFEVTLKLLLRKGSEVLLLVSPRGGFDFPGGRLDESELDQTFAEAIARETHEELGDEVKISVGDLAFVARRSYESGGKTHQVLAIYYEATYEGGEIALSDEHKQFQWVEPSYLLENPDRFVSADEHAQFTTYFAIH